MQVRHEIQGGLKVRSVMIPRNQATISKRDRWKYCPERTWKLTWPRKRRRYRDESSDWQPASQSAGTKRARCDDPWINRIDPSVDHFLPPFISLSRVEKWRRAGRKVVRRWSREEVHKSRLERRCGTCFIRVHSSRIRGQEERGRRRTTLSRVVRACIESTYVRTRPRRGQASFAERPRVPPPTFPSWFAIVMQICRGSVPARFLRHDSSSVFTR